MKYENYYSLYVIYIKNLVQRQKSHINLCMASPISISHKKLLLFGVQCPMSSNRIVLSHYSCELNLFFSQQTAILLRLTTYFPNLGKRRVHASLNMFCAIQYQLYNFKNVKNTHGGVLLSVKLQAVEETLLHRCFSNSLNCTNGTKSRIASYYGYSSLIMPVSNRKT